jgi:DNA end-binding protein Ku
MARAKADRKAEPKAEPKARSPRSKASGHSAGGSAGRSPERPAKRAAKAPRVVWKGAIMFGLVHIPVSLYPLARNNDLDFDWIDKRDLSPVGYRRVNKRTGREVEPQNIVKGYQYEPGRYVLLDEADFRAASPQATQTVEITGFVEAGEIPPYYFETPYHLAPGPRGEKGYALLRETLQRSGRAGLAKVVIHTRQHLAAVLAHGNALLLNTMRFAGEILAIDHEALPPRRSGKRGGGKPEGVGDRELDMARRLVDDMTGPWHPEDFSDTYRDELMRHVQARIQSGATHEVAAPAQADAPAGAQVIDLMAALRQSLQHGDRKAGKPAARTPAPRTPAQARPRRAAG